MFQKILVRLSESRLPRPLLKSLLELSITQREDLQNYESLALRQFPTLVMMEHNKIAGRRA
jgi:hypothetical protein